MQESGRTAANAAVDACLRWYPLEGSYVEEDEKEEERRVAWRM